MTGEPIRKMTTSCGDDEMRPSVGSIVIGAESHRDCRRAALAKIDPFNGQSPGRFRAGDELLAFLDKL